MTLGRVKPRVAMVMVPLWRGRMMVLGPLGEEVILLCRQVRR